MLHWLRCRCPLPAVLPGRSEPAGLFCLSSLQFRHQPIGVKLGLGNDTAGSFIGSAVIIILLEIVPTDDPSFSFPPPSILEFFKV